VKSAGQVRIAIMSNSCESMENI